MFVNLGWEILLTSVFCFESFSCLHQTISIRRRCPLTMLARLWSWSNKPLRLGNIVSLDLLRLDFQTIHSSSSSFFWLINCTPFPQLARTRKQGSTFNFADFQSMIRLGAAATKAIDQVDRNLQGRTGKSIQVPTDEVSCQTKLFQSKARFVEA